MLNFDTRTMLDERREALAWHVRNLNDFDLPHLDAWNYDLCRQHRMGWDEKVMKDGEEVTHKVYDRPFPGCRKCGIHFHKHQRVSIAWLYLRKRALLADTMGTGKTTSAGGLVAMMLQTGELADPRDGGVGRVIITPRAPALHQWRDELQRMMPGLNVLMAQGPAKERYRAYAQEWQVLLIGPEMLLNDADKLERIPLAAFITDDIDTIRNPDNRQAYEIKRLGRRADRFIEMTGTPLQKKLPELHSVLDPIGGLEVFGSMDAFVNRYTRYENDSSYDPNLGRRTTSKRIVGYKRLDEVKRKMAPMVLRRTVDQLDDVHMPAIQTNDVMLDLYPSQRAAYKELQTGVIQLLREEGAQTKHVTALSKIHYGAAICGGLATLHGVEQDGPGTSVKMDWIQEKLNGELENEKVVIFANYKNSVRALQDRFRADGIGFTTVWGEDPNKERRRQSQERFWEDKSCRVLIGTRAIEQSLNLQVARHLINMDLIMNPARMEQLAGRVRRTGSAYKHVFVHNLLTIDTQEERYLPALEREAALSGFIWGENSQLFQALSPTALLHLISG